MLFYIAIVAHILSLFFRFTLEQLTERARRQQRGKEASPAEQIGESGQAPPGPLRSCDGMGDSWTIGPSVDPRNPSGHSSTP